MNDMTLDDAIQFFRSAGFVVLTDDDIFGTGDEDEGAEDDD